MEAQTLIAEIADWKQTGHLPDREKLLAKYIQLVGEFSVLQQQQPVSAAPREILDTPEKRAAAAARYGFGKGK